MDTLILRPSSTLDDIYHLESDDRLHGQENYHNVFVHDNTGFLNNVETDPVSNDLYIYDISDTGNPTYAGESIHDINYPMPKLPLLRANPSQEIGLPAYYSGFKCFEIVPIVQSDQKGIIFKSIQ